LSCPATRSGDTRTVEYLEIVAGDSRQWEMILKQLVHDHLDDLIDILERLFRGSALRDRAVVAERRAIGVVARPSGSTTTSNV